MTSSGDKQDFEFDFTAFSGSASMQYIPGAGSNFYYRYSLAHKIPELSFYTQNFSGDKEDIQKLSQHEIGYRRKLKRIRFSTAFFHNMLSDVNTSDFVFDQNTNELFYSPVQNQTHKVYGAEIETEVNLTDHWIVTGQATFQNSKCSTCPVYNAMGTVEEGDDIIEDFSSKRLAQIHGIMGDLGIDYSGRKLGASFSWNIMEDRQGNSENNFSLPAFHTVDWSTRYRINDNLGISFSIINVFNSGGLTNFFGPNTFGGSANQATAEYISSNPNGSFGVFPILPRAFYFRVTYQLSGEAKSLPLIDV